MQNRPRPKTDSSECLLYVPTHNPHTARQSTAKSDWLFGKSYLLLLVRSVEFWQTCPDFLGYSSLKTLEEKKNHISNISSQGLFNEIFCPCTRKGINNHHPRVSVFKTQTFFFFLRELTQAFLVTVPYSLIKSPHKGLNLGVGPKSALYDQYVFTYELSIFVFRSHLYKI